MSKNRQTTMYPMLLVLVANFKEFFRRGLTQAPAHQTTTVCLGVGCVWLWFFTIQNFKQSTAGQSEIRPNSGSTRNIH